MKQEQTEAMERKAVMDAAVDDFNRDLPQLIGVKVHDYGIAYKSGWDACAAALGAADETATAAELKWLEDHQCPETEFLRVPTAFDTKFATIKVCRECERFYK